MRFAAYVRISSEDQVGNFSLDAQKRAIQTWIRAQKGTLVKTYVDEAQSGRSADRPGFQQMRRDARKGKMDAIVVHKFDRFARNRTDALAIKSLLRHDYGIKILSVSEPSEDSDGPMGALIEGIMESVADWYSQNLATETTKGKRERATQGFHNNQAPFGLKKAEDGKLVPDEAELPGLLMAFGRYASAACSDNDVAMSLNEQGYQTKTGRPFSKDSVRFMLQNRTYLGKIRYQQTIYNTDGSRSRKAQIQWLDGQHRPVIDEYLFEQCQRIRANRRRHHQSTTKYRPYLLRGIVFCHKCCCAPPEGKTFSAYGKMRAQSLGNGKTYYRCRANEMGYECTQRGVRSDALDNQVLGILKHLAPPPDWNANITKAIGELLGENDLEDRLRELRNMIRRMDARWDNGFFENQEEYFEKRLRLQTELEQLTPVDNEDLANAADLLQNFGERMDECGEDVEAQHSLVRQVIERVYVEDQEVVAMTLKSNYHLVLGHNINGPTEYSVDPFIAPDLTDPSYASGDDGI